MVQVASVSSGRWQAVTQDTTLGPLYYSKLGFDGECPHTGGSALVHVGDLQVVSLQQLTQRPIEEGVTVLLTYDRPRVSILGRDRTWPSCS